MIGHCFDFFILGVNRSAFHLNAEPVTFQSDLINIKSQMLLLAQVQQFGQKPDQYAFPVKRG